MKDNQPDLELNRSAVSNNGLPESLSIKTPSGVSLNISYCLQNLLSVHSLKATLKASEFLPNLNSPRAS